MRPDLAARLVQRLQQVWLTRGVLARLLWPLSCVFGCISGVRRALFRTGLLRRQSVAVPVIVVGNLIAGGAGKTPVVIALAAMLRAQGRKPGIVSRGHGRRGSEVREVQTDTPVDQGGDEPLLIRLRTGAPTVVGTDRVAAARHLLAEHPEVDILLSDDGLQHLRLARDLHVLVFDARGAGNGWLLPAGPLREALPERLPARTLVVYNAATASTPLPGTCTSRRLAGLVPLADWWDGRHASREALESLRGGTVWAAAGIAQPERFFDMLRANGLQVNPLALPDHHDFATLPWPEEAADVVVTEKDAVKLHPARVGATRVWVAPLDFHLAAAFEAALLDLLPPPGKSHGNATA